MAPRIIDTHIHIWDFDKAEYDWLKENKSILNRSYSIDELKTEQKEANITEGILVQAANNFEDTDWMLEVAERTDWISAVVGWLPLKSPELTQKALDEKYSKNNYFKGIRHLIHDEPDVKWLLQPTVIESLQVVASYHLPYDIVGVTPEHIQTALQVAEKVPELRMVFDHINQPPIARNEKFGKWGELIKRASENKNFFGKISGLGTASGKAHQWNEKDIKPYIEFVLEHFTINRCFCGGDWPVSLLAGSYSNTWSIYKNTLSSLLNQADLEKVFYSNARNFYDL
jgi:L-fuconolactonase